ncbi:GntR family transcriptional regulator [Mesorhizobium sp. L2C089B000]|nr:GntR family transcriptional regulator [Mesorhizobium sp. L2C089B000]
MSHSAIPYAQTPATAEQEAFLHLQSAIRLGRYRAGDRLIPEEIAAEIGMSRMPVREAFQRLAVDGLVVIRPNRGCIVAGLTLNEIYETFEIRSVLEGLAVRLAMPRMNAETIAELERLLARMERSGAAGGADWVTRHQEFHGYICNLSGRPKLIRQIASLHVTIEPYLRIWFDYVEKPLSAAEEHSAVIDSLRGGDAEAAEAVMRRHILDTAPLLAEFASPSRR